MLLKFVNREKELEKLENAYQEKTAQLWIIYGRRRIGKTELIKHFIKNKPSFYFLAKQQPLKLEFERFKEKISKKLDLYLPANSWEELFHQITKKTRKRLVIVIDEFPYWITKDKGILSEFQHLWDENLKNKNIFLILTGSYLSIMEQEVLGYKSPLFGRRTGQIELHPLKTKHISEFLPNYTTEEKIMAYGALDTIPYYLQFFNPEKPFWENIEQTFLDPTHPLHNDAEILLSSELRAYNTYFNIIKVISEGATKLTEISGKTHVNITNIPKYLNTLLKMKIIRKIKPVTSPPKQKHYLYEIEDNYFRFWLTYIYPFQEEIIEDPASHIEYIKTDYSRYMGHVFEVFVQKNLRTLTKKSFTTVGKWWDKENEIDIVGLNEKTNEILLAECKWKNNVNAEKLLISLKQKSELLKWKKGIKKHFAIFAKSFSKKPSENCQCIDLSEIERVLWKN